MENINKNLEEQLAEFDHLFQECVLIKKEDMEHFDFLMKKFAQLRKEMSKRPDGFYVKDILNFDS
jgi:hypothetical protein